MEEHQSLLNGVDDYLHQAASSEWWPNGITYDPDNSGTAIGSLGTHEHWNNGEEMQYSRNLQTGEGIELVKVFDEEVTALNSIISSQRINIFPNPCDDFVKIGFNLNDYSSVSIEVFDLKGMLVRIIPKQSYAAGYNQLEFKLSDLPDGTYICLVKATNSNGTSRIAERIIKR